MEDIRINEIRKKLDSGAKFGKILLHFKKNWWKYLIIILLLFIIIFPTIFGHLLGSWWNTFASSFLKRLTYKI